MVEFPQRGQRRPNYWDAQLKAYIDAGEAVISAITTIGSAAWELFATIFGLSLGVDPRQYGAVGDGVTDDTAALRAAVAAAGPGGTVLLPPKFDMRVRPDVGDPILISGVEIRGSAMGGSIIRCDRDRTVFRDVWGAGTCLRNFTFDNHTVGNRTYPDFEFINPNRPVIDNVKVTRAGNPPPSPSTATGAASIVFRKDAGLPGSSAGFMPVIDKLWLANGWMLIDGVTDGKMSNSFVWATFTGADGAIEMRNIAGWTFTGNDVVPPVNGDGGGYLFSGAISFNNVIQGGYVDGSYNEFITGNGLKVTSVVRALRVVGVGFYNLGRSGIKTSGMSHSTIQGCTFSQCNKADNFYPDVDLTGGIGNTFIGNTHRAPDVRTNKAFVYVEDGTSGDNLYADMTLEINPAIVPNGHYYGDQQFSLVDSALVRTPRPNSRWRISYNKNISAPYTVTVYDIFQRRALLVSAGAAIALPSAGSVHAGDFVVIKNTSTSVTVTITPNGVQTIDAAATLVLQPMQSATLYTDGSNWYIEGNDTSLVHRAGTETITGAKTFTAGATVTGSPLASGNGIRFLDSTRTAAVTLLTNSPTNEWCDATGGAFTVTLPATTQPGIEFRIKKIDASGNAITVSPGAGGTIDGASTYSLSAQYSTVVVVSTGTSGVWRIVGKF